MNNFIQFLLDYYVWILVVLGIMIITIIGFLVDSKQKRKKMLAEVNSTNEVKTPEPLEEKQPQETAPIMEAKNEPVPTVVDNVIGGNGVYVNETPVSNNVQASQNLEPVQNNAVNTVNTINPNLTLGEQKPHFEPREVPMPQNKVNAQNVVTPQPVRPVAINQPINQSINKTVNPQVTGQVSQQIPRTPEQTYVAPQPVNPMVSQQAVRPVQPTMPQANQTVMPNVVGNINPQPVSVPNTTTQNVNVLPQQPVGVMPKAQVNQIPVPPVQNVVQPAQPVSNPEPTVTTPNIGISFVTGDASNNTSNDDTWKL